MITLLIRSANPRESEEPGNECNLPGDIILRQPSDLLLSNHVHRFDRLNRPRRRM